MKTIENLKESFSFIEKIRNNEKSQNISIYFNFEDDVILPTAKNPMGGLRVHYTKKKESLQDAINKAFSILGASTLNGNLII